MTVDAEQHSCDVLIVGTGAAGMTAAITAATAGLKVALIEKDRFFGGTTAFSGGILWIPGNDHAKAQGLSDDRTAAATYIRHEAGNMFDASRVDAFLEKGPEAIRFLEQNSEVRFVLADYPDYHAESPGGVLRGRSLATLAFDGRALGPELSRLRRPLRTITFLGMTFNSANADLKHFFNATKSLASALYVAKRLARHLRQLLTHGRGLDLTSGNALAARLAKSVLDLGITIRTETSLLGLMTEDGSVIGAFVEGPEGRRQVRARLGVVLATGGYPHDEDRRRRTYAHVAAGGAHLSPIPSCNSGDGMRAAAAIGAIVDEGLPNAAAWIPVSRVPRRGGTTEPFPHLVDRYKPGIIAVDGHGERFCNEANSYHDFGEAMQSLIARTGEAKAWLIADRRAIRKYGLGFAKPAPVPLQLYLASGYLKRGRTLAELADSIGVDSDRLQMTFDQFNADSARGRDDRFGRGEKAFNRYLGDGGAPHPNLAPLDQAPFYAVELVIGDLGTFNGLKTDSDARVLDAASHPITGLYAIGNDAVSVMGGAYPGAGITLGPAVTAGYSVGRHLAGLSEAVPPEHTHA